MANQRHPTRIPSGARAQRAPEGVISEKPIALRLMPAELHTVKTLAAHEQRSMASVCRLVLLRGLAEIEKDPQHRLVL